MDGYEVTATGDRGKALVHQTLKRHMKGLVGDVHGAPTDIHMGKRGAHRSTGPGKSTQKCPHEPLKGNMYQGALKGHRGSCGTLKENGLAAKGVREGHCHTD